MLFINMIKVLYKNPTAVALTGKTSSPPFAVSRGSRQDCPLSPLLFSLSLELLAQPSATHLQFLQFLLTELIITFHFMLMTFCYI